MNLKTLAVLLSTSALTICGNVYAHEGHDHHHHKNEVKLKFSINTYMGFTNQKNRNQGATAIGNAQQTMDRNLTVDPNVGVLANYTADNGMKYGGEVTIEDDSSAFINASGVPQPSSGAALKRAYVYNENRFGRFEGGAVEGAGLKLEIGAESIAVASGGIGGADLDFAMLSGPAVGGDISNSASGKYDNTNGRGVYLISPELEHAENGIASGKLKRANKISYYTPVVSGLQAGISYTPDLRAFGSTTTTNKYLYIDPNGADSASYKNDAIAIQAVDMWGAGVTYGNSIKDIDYKIALVGLVGKNKKPAPGIGSSATYFHDLKSYNIGGKISYKEYSFAASYVDFGKSFINKTYGKNNPDVRNRHNETYYYTVGGAYNDDKIGASLTYFHSSRMKNRFNHFVAGFEYKLTPGMVPYAEIGHFEANSIPDSTDTRVRQHGNSLLLGTKFEL